ncbi:hypothetical protein [Nocardia fluminea]|uniref:hypothetical protein n=1 Tax=Nocardia fluminea TaxID=134984 RepID=UPI003D0FB586
MSLEDLLPVPTDEDRADGWDDYLYTWSTGEVLGVALLLDDQAVLDEFGESRGSVLSRDASDLFGMRAARADVEAGSPTTAAWFAETAAALTT